MPSRPKPNILVRTYERARARTRATEQRELSPKEFLDLIDPKGRRSESSAARYMRKLRSGERTGSTLEKRAKADSGRTVDVQYRVGEYRDPKTGEVFPDIRSALVTIPTGKSRLDFWTGDRLRKAVDAYLKDSYTRRVAQLQSNAEVYEALSKLPKTAQLVAIRGVRRAKYPTQILR